jgi:flagellar protein FlaJ
MTSAIVTVMAVVTMMIGNATTMFILVLSVLTIVVTIAGAWLIHRATPKEDRVHSLQCRSREQNIARYLSKITIIAAVVLFTIMVTTGAEIGWIMVVLGVVLFPLGLVSKMDDSKISKRDMDISGFLRSLGGVSGAIGATVNEAIGRLDIRSLGSLKDNVNLLYTRILARINPNLCWNTFVGETGSEQVNRAVRIFWDAVNIGGEPQRVGNVSSAFAMKISLLRAKRGMISGGFLWLTITMHAVLVVLLMFVYETMRTFTSLIQSMSVDSEAGAEAGLPSFMAFASNSSEMSLLYFMIIVIIIVLIVSNAFTTHSMNGGHLYCFAFYLAITLVLSGIAMNMVPPVVGMLFGGLV